jgi:hypothetical protein
VGSSSIQGNQKQGLDQLNGYQIMGRREEVQETQSELKIPTVEPPRIGYVHEGPKEATL